VSLPEKISFRPGPLAGAMARRLKATGEKPSTYIRRLIAEDCGRKEPAMDGHVKTIRKVNRAKRKPSQ